MANRKEKYAGKALLVFKQDGLRLSLDEIADRIGVTKKTLYNHFESKEALLSECIHSLVSELRESMPVMYSDEVNAVEGLKAGIDVLNAFFNELSPVFLFDLKKFYPEIANTEHESGFGLFLRSVSLNLVKGKKEGLYRENLDIEMISQFFIHSLVSFYIGRVTGGGGFSSSDYFRNITDYHLHAIVTDKGRALIKF